ncbi:MAG: esterase [Thermoanaerobaculia bacterium]
MNIRRLWPVAFSALLTACAAGAEVMRWTVDGRVRKALVFPPTTGGGKAPVVFAFHGHGANMCQAAWCMAFQKAWPEALVVYMQGLPTPSGIDPCGLLRGWQHYRDEKCGRDLKFFDAVLSTLRQKYPVDDRHIYATGFSNGAHFTYLLWVERGKTFAAFAPCAGLIWCGLHLTEPRSALHLGGQRDLLVKIRDQEKTIETVRQLNGATGQGTSCGPYCIHYSSTPPGTPVETYLHPCGHVFPRGATERIVRFFKEYSQT